jgi:16S rRNA (guanine527-N7)-methyltransferase
MPGSEAALQSLMRNAGMEPDSDQSRQLQAYLALLKKWNSRMNLTSSTSWDVVGPFFREGLWAAGLYPEDATRHLDIGSGAGFPAVLLKILKPHIRLDLVESRERKGIFLETAASALKLSGTSVHTMRLQAFLRQSGREEAWDCVSWKALRLSREDVRVLREHATGRTQLWMFHGSERAVEDPASLEQYFRRLRTEKFPDRKLWALSIYLPR